ncbi:SDR family NAD(P)-dependent oxidoreductase [Mycolicibacterium setense]
MSITALDQSDAGLSEAATPIAIVGAGCRTPGGVTSPAGLDRFLRRKVNAAGPLPHDRWNVGELEAAVRQNPALRIPQQGSFLADVRKFDAEFFGLAPRVAESVDPQHRLLMETSWEALEHAGIRPSALRGTRGGVFLGITNADYMTRIGGRPDLMSGYMGLGVMAGVGAGRLSHLLGLSGPALALDSTCSSSLTAVHLACASLSSGESDLAIAGGVNLILAPHVLVTFSQLNMMSASGACRSFDSAADGFVRGEGCGVVILKRLADVTVEDRVLAVIRGSAINQEGPFQESMMSPSVDAQIDVLSAAVSRSGVDPGVVGLVETHGTGTPVGDPIEFAATAHVYGDGEGRCALGAAKGSLGHLEAAAGVIGLIKVTQCLRQGTIPPNAGFREWHPGIDPSNTRLFIPTEETAWPVAESVRFAAVSAFGVSGTNAHVVLEQAPSPPRYLTSNITPQPAHHPEVFAWGASTIAKLPDAADVLADWLSGDGATVPLSDIAYTLTEHRDSPPARLATTASTHADLISKLRAYSRDGDAPGVHRGLVPRGADISRPVFVFSGHGSQWPAMGRELLETAPAFAEAIEEVEAVIRTEAGYSVIGALGSPEIVTDPHKVQPTLYAMQLGLVALWHSYGVEPDAVIGHSMGEVAAAVAAQGLSPIDGARVICRRSRLLAQVAGIGAMATVAMNHHAVTAELRDRRIADVVVAVIAAPESTVVSGDATTINELVERWDSRGIAAHLVAVDTASHCPLIDPLLPQLASELADIEPLTLQKRVFSTTADDPRAIPKFDADYWCRNLRSPVRLLDAVTAAALDGYRGFIEISPHPLLTHSLRETFSQPEIHASGTGHRIVVTMQRDGGIRDFHDGLAQAHTAGIAISLATTKSGGRIVDVPTTVYDRRDYWIDVEESTRTGPLPDPVSTPLTHPLLGDRCDDPTDSERTLWHLSNSPLTQLPWLGEHLVHDEVVLPGAAYCEIALTAATELFEALPTEVAVTDIRFDEILRLTSGTVLITTATRTKPTVAELAIWSRDTNASTDVGWSRHATATLRHCSRQQPIPNRIQVSALSDIHTVDVAVEASYELAARRGVSLGPCFRQLCDIKRTATRPVGVSATIGQPETGQPGPFRFHPITLDACLQAMAFASMTAAAGNHADTIVLPIAIDSLQLIGKPSTATRCVGGYDSNGAAQIKLLTDDGDVVAAMHGVRYATTTPPLAEELNEPFYEVAWNPSPRGYVRAIGDQGSWLLVGDSEHCGGLVEMMTNVGAHVDVVHAPIGCDEQLAEGLAGHIQNTPSYRGVVLLEGESTVDRIDAAPQRFSRAVTLIQQVASAPWPEAPRLWFVTEGARAILADENVDVGQSALRGLGRVVALEHRDLHITQVDLDPTASPPDRYEELLAELIADREEDEVAVRGGTRYVGVLTHRPHADRAQIVGNNHTAASYGHDGFHLAVQQPGSLTGSTLVQRQRNSPTAGRVEVAVEAAGVNFRDLLISMGLTDEIGSTNNYLGLEAVGRISAVGTGVTGLQPGDRVIAIEPDHGTFGTFIDADADLVWRVSDKLSPEEWAAAITPYITAWYSLHTLAHIAAGEKVLIHAASGGVGQAAVAIAQAVGAEIFATAGSEEKRQFLRAQGIEHVMDSRTNDFAAQIEHITGGQGIDVVLNSLTGEAIAHGINLLKIGGRFIEIGKRDIYADSRIGLRPFSRNISFHSVDIHLLSRTQVKFIGALIRQVVTEIEQDRLPALPTQQFALADYADAFRLMAGAKHIGRLVLTVPTTGHVDVSLPPRPVVRPDGAYIITGGLTGIGFEMGHWLANEGAGALILNGRRPPNTVTEQRIAKLRTAGTKVIVVRGDIAEPQTARALVEAAQTTGLQLRGIIHSAAALRDATITGIDSELIKHVWPPKVDGALNLHEASIAEPLDWFVLFSSLAALTGSPGQGVYAAANAWLDGFAGWRRAQGLHGLSVGWGPWGEVGLATDFAVRGYPTISNAAGTAALRMLLEQDRRHTGYLPQVDKLIEAFNFFGGSSLLSEIAPAGAETPPLANGPSTTAAAPGVAVSSRSREDIEAYLVDAIRSILRLGAATPIGLHQELRNIGFDSLLAMELRHRIQKDFSVKLTSKVMASYPRLVDLVDAIDKPREDDRSASAHKAATGAAVRDEDRETTAALS